VDDPLAGFEIEWSTAGPNLAAFVAAVPGSGAESGARNSVFTLVHQPQLPFMHFQEIRLQDVLVQLE
jgi:hypothetical protein